MWWLIVVAAFAAGLTVGLAMVVVEFGAWALVLPRRGEQTPLSLGTTEVIRVRAADGVELAGRWAPAAAPTGRTLILIHGFVDGPSMMLIDRASVILARGWNVAAIDLRGYGESRGVYSTFGAREAGDLSVWLDAITLLVPASEPFTPVVWGRSMGAAIALRGAVEDPRVQALVLEAPMVDLRRSVTTVMRRRRVPLARTLSRLVVRRAGRIAGAPLARPGSLELAPQFDRPVVVVHGSNDELIPAAAARRLAEAFPTPAAYLEVPGAKHVDVARVGGRTMLEQVMDLLETATKHVSADDRSFP